MAAADYHRTFEHLHELLEPKLSNDSLQNIVRAYELAETAHTGQMRDEGTPYILHPLRVAILIAEELDNYSPDLLCSALLHDVIEDTDVTREQITGQFGANVGLIVWLMTKLEDVSLPAYLAAIEAHADLGAPLVKLSDRLDNLRFLVRSPKAEKKRRYIRTTEQYYLPIASRCNAYLYKELCNSLEQARTYVSRADHSDQS